MPASSKPRTVPLGHHAHPPPTHPPTPPPPQTILFPYGEDKDYIDEYKVYKGPTNITDMKEFVFKNLPDLTTRLETNEAVSAFIHRCAPGGRPRLPHPQHPPCSPPLQQLPPNPPHPGPANPPAAPPTSPA